MRYVPKPPDLLLYSSSNPYSFELVNNLIFKIIELYQSITKYAEENEGGCIEFQLFTEVNPESRVEELFTIDKYANPIHYQPYIIIWRCRKSSGLTYY